jgi:enamine deaminase RidA (YjgF/YER057c/UK114 family)
MLSPVRASRKAGPAFIFILLSFQVPEATAQARGNTYINPPGLTKPTGYTHVVVASDRRTVYIAGQVALDSTGKLVGGSDVAAQTEQVFANLRRALASVGASFADVVKTTTFITDAKQIAALREVRGRYLNSAQLPASTLVVVTALARPELLVEIEAVAFLQADRRTGGRADGRTE